MHHHYNYRWSTATLSLTVISWISTSIINLGCVLLFPLVFCCLCVCVRVYVCTQDFAELIVKLTESNSTIKHLPATLDDPRQRKPDITTAKTKIGWQPKVSEDAATLCQWR
jgi:hypothetical protein